MEKIISKSIIKEKNLIKINISKLQTQECPKDNEISMPVSEREKLDETEEHFSLYR